MIDGLELQGLRERLTDRLFHFYAEQRTTEPRDFEYACRNLVRDMVNAIAELYDRGERRRGAEAVRKREAAIAKRRARGKE